MLINIFVYSGIRSVFGLFRFGSVISDIEILKLCEYLKVLVRFWFRIFRFGSGSVLVRFFGSDFFAHAYFLPKKQKDFTNFSIVK